MKSETDIIREERKNIRNMSKTTVNLAFDDIYGKQLIFRGFKKLKGYKMYINLINDEVIQFISVINIKTGIKELKGFTIIAGMVSIYNTTVSPKDLLIMQMT